jgi:endonuclease YncB( thermonuclease family)
MPPARKRFEESRAWEKFTCRQCRTTGLVSPESEVLVPCGKFMTHHQQLTLCVLCALLSLPIHGAETLSVQQVLDGDTCRLSDNREVRYLGIDAPEKGEPLAEEATQANNRLVGGKNIRLEIGKPEKDRDGRLLAYVSVDTTLVNEALVREGFAWVRRPLDAKHRDILLKAQEEARTAGRGIWSGATNIVLVVAAVHARPARGRADLTDEYIVIENRGKEAVDMTGWSILDETHHRYLVPNFALPAKAKVTLRTGVGKNTATELFWGSRASIWNDEGDSVFIRDSQGRLVASHFY